MVSEFVEFLEHDPYVPVKFCLWLQVDGNEDELDKLEDLLEDSKIFQLGEIELSSNCSEGHQILGIFTCPDNIISLFDIEQCFRTS